MLFSLRTFFLFSFIVLTLFAFNKKSEERMLSYVVDLTKERVEMRWKGNDKNPLMSFDHLITQLESEGKTIRFLMNAGMYDTKHAPIGLYIENKVLLHKVNRATGASGNFYMQPNGIFAISTHQKPVIVPTDQYAIADTIQYATQSGPMLVINGKINPLFAPKSVNTNIRNGVGIMPNNKVIFVMSKTEVTFYEFASYFKKLGCKNALYLDGAISRSYCPSANWLQKGGEFGVMIAVTSK